MNSPPANSSAVTSTDGQPLWVTTAGATVERTPWAALLALIALALVLRVIGLNQGLWWDEIRTLLDSVRSPLSRIVTVYPGDNQHTLFSVLAHLSIAVFGEQPWSLRFPALLFGVATIPVLFFCAREFVGRIEALAAALLLTLSYHHVWFSQSARGYSALAFFSPLCTLLLLRGLRRSRLSDFLWYGIAAAAAIYTHVTMVFLVASHAVLCLIPLGMPRFNALAWQRWRGPLIGFAVAAGVSLALYLPFLLEVREAVVDAPSPMRGATPRWAALELLRGMQLGLGGVLGAAVGAIVFFAGLRSYARQSRFLLGLFVLPGVVTLVGAVMLHRPVRPRFVFFLAGFLLMIAVRGALEIGKWIQRRNATLAPGVTPVGVALLLMMSGLSAISLRPNYRLPKQDFVGAMAYVDDQAQAGDVVVTAGGARYPYHAYFQRSWEQLGSRAMLDSLRAGGARIWVVHTMDSYIRAQTPDLMEALESACTAPRVFHGTVGDGEITVCTFDSTNQLGRPTPALRPL